MTDIDHATASHTPVDTTADDNDYVASHPHGEPALTTPRHRLALVVLARWRDTLVGAASGARAAGDVATDRRWRAWAALVTRLIDHAPAEMSDVTIAEGFVLLVQSIDRGNVEHDWRGFYLRGIEVLLDEHIEVLLDEHSETSPDIITVAVWSDLATRASIAGDVEAAAWFSHNATGMALTVAGCESVIVDSGATVGPTAVDDAHEAAVLAQYPDAEPQYGVTARSWVADSVRGDTVTACVSHGAICVQACDGIECADGDRVAVLSRRFDPVPVLAVLRRMRDTDPQAFARFMHHVHATNAAPTPVAD